jgi:hypothetical protein
MGVSKLCICPGEGGGGGPGNGLGAMLLSDVIWFLFCSFRRGNRPIRSAGALEWGVERGCGIVGGLAGQYHASSAEERSPREVDCS